MTFADPDGVTHRLVEMNVSWLASDKVMVRLLCHGGWRVLLVRTLHDDQNVDCMTCLAKDR